MISVISPAKTLDFESPCDFEPTQPRLTTQANKLIRVMKTKKSDEIQKLMSVSANIADLNVKRYKDYRQKHTTDNSKQCMFAFKGDVYIGLEAETFDSKDVNFAQEHLRILSGLYGLLRPLDLIQPYRLEMGTRLAFDDYNTLYAYWEDQITKLVNKDLKAQGDNTILNLASNEYFKSIRRKSLKANIVDVEFKDNKDGNYKVISFFAKKARGMMSRYIVKNQINNVEDLKGFDYEGYYFAPKESSANSLLFKRG